MTRPKDGSYLPDSKRFPGRVCHTSIPDSLRGQLRSESMEIVQSYKGHAALQCRVCGACTVVEVAEDADWSCPACSARKFEAACGRITKVGIRHERPHARPDRLRHRPSDRSGQRPLAA